MTRVLTAKQATHLPPAWVAHAARLRSAHLVAPDRRRIEAETEAGLRRDDGARPLPSEVSSGIVGFEVDGMTAPQAVDALRQRDIVATVTPYPARDVRLAPSIRNTPVEVNAALQAVRDLA